MLLLFCLSFSVLPLAATEYYRGGTLCVQKGEALRMESGEASAARKYAPDRMVDVRHLKLEVVPDFKRRSLEGIATLRFSPIAKPIEELRLDAVNLRIAKVESSHKLESFHNSSEQLVLQFEKPVTSAEEVEVEIRYEAEPQDGLFFRTAEMGYLAEDTHLWTQGEPEKHRHWFPSYDYPNEQFSTEMICHVPEGMTVLSNGKWLGSEPSAHGVRHHWLQEKPHVNYLVSLVAGYLKHLKDDYRGIPLAFYTPPSNFAEAKNSFADTKAILEYFEEEIGVPYPWDKYYSVCVQGYPYGGMENTSVTTLTTRTLFTTDFENLRSSRFLDAHEIAHQWFGNLVTCKDWTHLWLNEGFATYYTELYEGHKHSRDHMLYGMHRAAQRVFRAKDTRPIAWREYERPWEQFDHRAYPKGAWVLHMLRNQLGDELFRQAVRTYLKRHRHNVVVTEDLNAALEDVSGFSLDRFFDQWVYHGGHPQLEIRYAWDGKRKQAKLTVAQTQKRDEDVLLFHFPLPVRFYTKEQGKHFDFAVEVTQPREEFYFALPQAPTAVRIDPEYSVLAEMDIRLPQPLVEAQAMLKGDAMGRMFAAQQLGKRQDATSLEVLEEQLRKDRFFGVREAAAKAIGARRSPEALAVLAEFTAEPDARVRREVVKSLGRFYMPEAATHLQRVVQEDTNPDIVTDGLAGLAKYPGEPVEQAILGALNRDSFRHTIALAAIAAMRMQDHVRYVQPLLEHLRTQEDAFVDRDLGRALKDLGALAETSEPAEKAEVRQFLAGYLNTPREQLIQPAIQALEALGDPAAIAQLEPLAEDDGPRPHLSDAARKAIASLNGNKKPSQELGDLRKEVLDLQEALRKLRQEVEALRKQEEAQQAD